MKKKLLIYTALLGLTVSTSTNIVVSSSQVHAATTTQKSQTINTANNISDSLIESIDPYVTVKNNQYVLSPTVHSTFSKSEIESAQNMLKTSNERIIQSHMIIDPDTKTAETYSPFINFAAYNRHYTFKNFWWGTRYYFTSNAAVRELSHKFSNRSYMLQAAAIVTTALGSAPATLVSTAGATYFAKIASDLTDYNDDHIHHQIYMDLNYTGAYSFHILK